MVGDTDVCHAAYPIVLPELKSVPNFEQQLNQPKPKGPTYDVESLISRHLVLIKRCSILKCSENGY